MQGFVPVTLAVLVLAATSPAWAGPCPTDRLGALSGLDFFNLASHNRSQGPQVSFDRPERSPCLKRIGTPSAPAYREALAIIQSGRARLGERPRGDTPGFAPCTVDQEKQTKYLARAAAESESRAAIREGRRVYDPGIPVGAPGPRVATKPKGDMK